MASIRERVVGLFFAFALSITIADRSEAEFLPETRGIDAQIARGVVERAHPSTQDRRLEEGIRALIPDADRSCLPIDQQHEIHHQPRTAAQSDLTAALQQIRTSELGAWLVQMALIRGVTICLDRETALEAHYRSHLRLIGLSARLSPSGRVVFLAHELAHVPQHPRFSNNRRFSPGDMILLQRVREAAAEAIATRVLWQLRQQGITAPWKEKLTTAYRDIAESFESTMAKGQGTARELWSTRSAFHHWFDADWRLDVYDDLMLRTLARIVEDPIGLIPPTRHLSDRYLRSIADYAGQGFLIGGDGQSLIGTFRADGLSGEGQTRLSAILAKTDEAGTSTVTSLSGETLSAISPRPKPPGQY